MLILASITVITLGYRGSGHQAISGVKGAANDVFSPIQHGFDAALRPLGGWFAGALHYGSVQQQNGKLRAEIGRLQRQALAGQANRQALNTLEQLNGLPWTDGVPTVTAEVVAFNTSNFSATVQLNEGTSRGVAVGMPVVGGAGLVGTVTQAWTSGSTVRLISDTNSKVGVRLGTTSPVYAEVQGQGFGKPVSVNLIPPQTPGISRGQVVMTSGLSNASFPPNVPVAKIKSISSSPSSTQEAIGATPLADLSALQYVDVMLWEPSQ